MLSNTPLHFSEAIKYSGLVCNDNIIPDGKIHRFKSIGDHEPNSWYVLYESPIPAGAFGCWKRGISEKWCSKSAEYLSPTEKNNYEEQIKRARIAQEAEKEKLHQETREKAQKIWEKSFLADVDNPYLKAKQVKAYGIKNYKNTLIIPLSDNNGLLHGLQYIYLKQEEFKKKFLAGTAKKGHYFQLGEPKDTIYIVEGYATGATVYEAMEQCIVVAFDSGNLLSVAENIYKKYPNTKIVICADNDAYGDNNTGVEKATEAAGSIGAKVVIPDFKNVTTKPTDFNDLMILEGIAEVQRQLSANSKTIDNNNVPEGFFVNDEGVFFEAQDKEGNALPKVFICSKIDVAARTRDITGENHGRLLQFKDSDNKLHQWAMPMSLLAGDGVDYRRNLLNMGVIISANKKARDKLTDYLSNSLPQNTALCVERTGWHESVFVLPDKTFGTSTDKDIIFQSFSVNAEGFKTSGTIEEWRNNIAKYCRGNSRLVLAVSAAFAAPLLNLLDDESGGLHLNGASSTGKTTVLKVACSVWGERKRLQTWRSTSNGLEGVASLHNDSLLCLDEMSQIDPKEAGETAYMLANGAGKNRSKKDGSLQKKSMWRLLFLSSGEVGLADHISQIGKKIKAGQHIRFLDIPADAGKNLGIFENLHNFSNGSEFARYLDQKTKTYYGLPIRIFLDRITNHPTDELIRSIKELREDFIRELSIDNADGQVKRAAHRFSLIAAAGALASALGITGWEEAETIEALKKCFCDWLDNRGGIASHEEMQIISQVCGFFQKNHPSRFLSFSDLTVRVNNKAGFYKYEKDKLIFYVETEVFKHEVCSGLNLKHVIEMCVNKGWLVQDSSGNPTQSLYAPDSQKNRRFYYFTAKVLGGDNE